MENEQKVRKFLVDRLIELRRQLGRLDASEEKTKEAELRLQEPFDRLRWIVDAVPAFIAYVDANQCYRFVNGRYAELHGSAPETIPGQYVCDVIGKNAYQRAAPHIQAALADVLVEFEMPFGLDEKGRPCYVHASYVPDVRDDESVAGFVALIVDVSERKHAELALAASEERWRTVFECASVGMAIVDSEGRPCETNPALREFFAASDAELRKSRCSELTDGRDCADSSRLFAELVRGERARYRLEKRYVRGDGAVVWGDTSVSAVRDANGSFQYAVPMILDVTVRKQAEEALQRSEAAYRDLVAHAAHGIYRADPKGQLVMVNPALAQMLGYLSEHELLAINPGRNCFADPRAFEALMESLQRDGSVEARELEWKRRDGTLLTVRLSGRKIQSDRGDRNYFEMIVQDVTQWKLLGAQLRQAQKMEAVGRLAGGVAHDFNNILTVILGVTDLLLADLPEDDRRKADLMEIRDAAGRASSLTRQLLAFSRKQVLIPQRIDLSDLVRSAGRLLERVIGEDIEVKTALDPALGTVEADPGQLEQVLVNLAVNARDAMPGGGTLTLTTANIELAGTYASDHLDVQPGPYIMLAVSDTGVGLDPEVRAHLFEPFFTTKDPGKGTGLGLAMVYGIVKQSGGHITVHSERGHGATFKIYLPRVDGDAEPVRRENSRDVRGGTETILLVEDQESVRQLAQRTLEHYGYRVFAAQDGQDALELFKRHESDIDLIITDLVMPRMSGRALCETLRQEGKSVKFLIMSGYTDRDEAERATLDGEFPFLQKPWTIEAFVRRVREVLDVEPGA